MTTTPPDERAPAPRHDAALLAGELRRLAGELAESAAATRARRVRRAGEPSPRGAASRHGGTARDAAASPAPP